jgi:hypothetical protein
LGVHDGLAGNATQGSLFAGHGGLVVGEVGVVVGAVVRLRVGVHEGSGQPG